jgi:phosphatidylinositol glycan class B
MPSTTGAGSVPSRSSGSSSSGQVSSLHVFALLLAFRLSNALAVKTFFQPDEYFQALEPAWQVANGAESGAWITWVRELHPFAESPNPPPLYQIMNQ